MLSPHPVAIRSSHWLHAGYKAFSFVCFNPPGIQFYWMSTGNSVKNPLISCCKGKGKDRKGSWKADSGELGSSLSNFQLRLLSRGSLWSDWAELSVMASAPLVLGQWLFNRAQGKENVLVSVLGVSLHDGPWLVERMGCLVPHSR